MRFGLPSGSGHVNLLVIKIKIKIISAVQTPTPGSTAVQQISFHEAYII